MNDKVKELVERITVRVAYHFFEDYIHPEVEARKVVEEVLNDPDLYLQVTGKEPILTIDLGAGDETYCSIYYLSLAEELKEKE